jgi:hypothetical protein
MTTYNHAYTIAFELAGCTDETGESVTASQLIIALEKRLNNLKANGNEIIEATGLPYDTYEEE